MRTRRHLNRRVLLLVAITAAAAISAPVCQPFLDNPTPVVDIVLPGSADVYQARAGEQFEVKVRVRPSAAGVSSYSVSIEFDLAGTDAFDVLSVSESVPPGLDFNLSPGPGSVSESMPGVEGIVRSCEAATFGNGTTDPFIACVIVLRANGPLGDFVLAPRLVEPFDGLFDGQGADLTSLAVLQSTTVRVVP